MISSDLKRKEHLRETTLGLPGKRVLIIVENLPVPFDKRVWNEAKALHRAGYVVSVISPVGKGYEKRYEVIDDIGVYRHPLPGEGSGPLGYALEYSAALFWEILLAFRVLSTRGFDAIHACNPPDTIFLVGLLFRLFGKRFLFDHHDINPELYIAKFGRKGFFYYLMILLERLTFMTADIAIATNGSYREIAIVRGKMRPDKVYIVRSGPDLKKFQPVPPDGRLKNGNRYLVGYVGVMGKQEGLNYLLDAVSHVVHDRARTDVMFVIIGSGTEFDAIREYAKKLGLNKFVHFTGRIPDADLIRYLSTADVCVNPDVANEMNDKSTMNKIMEYMALGKPVVQFNLTEGRRSALDASLYARKNDAVDFADKLLFLLDNENLRRRMGEFGRHRVETVLAWEFSEKVLLEAYRALFRPSGSAPRLRKQALR
jgi:glycosyltransferase involved in cell wall biosynthesis